MSIFNGANQVKNVGAKEGRAGNFGVIFTQKTYSEQGRKPVGACCDTQQVQMHQLQQ